MEQESEQPRAWSKRQIQIIFYIGRGMTNRQVADRLFISPNTVKSTLRNITDMTGIHGRENLVEEAWRRGYLNPGLTDESANRERVQLQLSLEYLVRESGAVLRRLRQLEAAGVVNSQLVSWVDESTKVMRRSNAIFNGVA